MDIMKDQLSKEYEVNSLEWWEKYFGEGLWSYYDGGNQTLFFSKVAWEHINQAYIDVIMHERLSICDVGCAEGEAVNFMQKKFPKSKVIGIELTEHAVKSASQKFPKCCFICAALETITDTFDVIFSSNVLEHLKNPEKELQKLFNRAKRFLVCMCPINDTSGEPSHINIFDKAFFIKNCPQGGHLAQLEVIDTSILKETHWIGEQVLVVYEKENSCKLVASNQLVLKQGLWNDVAETYNITIEDSEIQWANEIEKILLEHGLKEGDSLIEMGCGSGHLSACLARKGYHVVLVDFSSIALEKASQTFEKYGLQGEFILADLAQLDESIPICDFAWNSEVMEYSDDESIIFLIQAIAKHAQKGVLYLVPNINSIAYLLMRARLIADDKWISVEEYLRQDYELLLKKSGYQFVEKSYITISSISTYQMWKAEKEKGNISELYKKLSEEGILPLREGYLVAYYATNYEQSITSINYQSTTEYDTKLFDLIATKIGYTEQRNQIDLLEHYIQELENKYHNLEAAHAEELSTYKQTFDQSNIQWENIVNEQKRIAEQNYQILQREYHELTLNMNQFQSIIKEKNKYIYQCQELCNHFATGKLMRLNHLFFRIKGQLLKGTKSDKKNFWLWIKGHIKHTNHTMEAGNIYNPLMVLHNKLQEAIDYWPVFICSNTITEREDSPFSSNDI